ncbi:MAG: hypothetical protein SVT56_02260 [Chloroflexota bacterium]|jgi:hypothetical protein|nr:hypothetical protein [Chloroflexota bacterium]
MVNPPNFLRKINISIVLTQMCTAGLPHDQLCGKDELYEYQFPVEHVDGVLVDSYIEPLMLDESGDNID